MHSFLPHEKTPK
jgi:type I restriction enzyme S subunit